MCPTDASCESDSLLPNAHLADLGRTVKTTVLLGFLIVRLCLNYDNHGYLMTVFGFTGDNRQNGNNNQAPPGGSQINRDNLSTVARRML
jgi:hypothetical protein